MQRQEIPNNTEEQVRQYLLDTLALIEEVDIPGDLRAVAFEQIFQARAGKQILMSQPQPVDLGNLNGLRGIL